MQLNLIAVRRGPKREMQDRDPILMGRAPIMTGDNLRFDLNGETVPGGLPISADEVTWKCFYHDLSKPDLEFLGSQDEEVVGKHFKIGGIGTANLDRSDGCTVNVRFHAGSPGSTIARAQVECRGEVASIDFKYVD